MAHLVDNAAGVGSDIVIARIAPGVESGVFVDEERDVRAEFDRSGEEGAGLEFDGVARRAAV